MMVVSANVREVVLDAAQVVERVHVVEPAAYSGFLELHRVRGFVLREAESVHGVVAGQFPPKARIVPGTEN